MPCEFQGRCQIVIPPPFVCPHKEARAYLFGRIGGKEIVRDSYNHGDAALG